MKSFRPIFVGIQETQINTEKSEYTLLGCVLYWPRIRQLKVAQPIMYLFNKGAFKEALCRTYLSGPSVTLLQNSAIPYYLFDISRSIWTQTFFDYPPGAQFGVWQCAVCVRSPVSSGTQDSRTGDGGQQGPSPRTWHETRGGGHPEFPSRGRGVERLSDTAAFPEMSHKIIYRVGPLVPESARDQSIPDTVQTWMNQQNGKPVVYVAFGSMAVPTPEQIAEIADALINLKVTNCILQLSLSVCEAHP